MNSRERIRAALEHRRPDRVPLDLGSTTVTGIAVGAYARLCPALGLPARPPRVADPYLMLAEMEDDIRDALGIDTVGLQPLKNRFGFVNDGWKPWRLFDGTEVLVPAGFTPTQDGSGDLFLHPNGDPSLPPSARLPRGGYYFDAIVRQQPIDWDHLDPEAWVRDTYSLYRDEDLRHLQAQAEALYVNTDRAVMASLSGAAFGDISHVPAVGAPHPRGIRDPLDWYVAHRTHPGHIKAIFELQCGIALENARLLWQAVGSRAEAVYVSGTDFGTQEGPFISPAMYRELYKRFHSQVNDWLHQHTTWKVFYHSCGSISGILDDLVEVGVDVINPVQCSAKGMDPAYLKARYGDRLVFWGGGVDTQRTLPFGTPEEVYTEVRERTRIFGRGGGYVFNPVHCIQQNVPVENLLAMFEAVRDAG